jgi:tetratricopeptide (TPR) repeat protein
MPGLDALPAGPRRDLVARLHDLYGQAGKPATRIISKRILDLKSSELETVSHETINSLLRGKSVPSWAKLRSVIVVLCRMSVQQVDIRRELVEFNALWVASPQAATLPADDPDVRPQLPGRPFAPQLPAIEPGTLAVVPRPPTGPVEARVHGELPGRATLFTGRERILDEIEGRLSRSPETPLILHGPVGAGKSQLVAEYIREHRDDYAITWWVRADSVDQARESLLGLMRSLDVPATDNLRHSFDLLFDLLAHSGPYLLVFDGVVSGDIRTLIRTRGGNVIVTTRNAAWAHESRHDGLEIPDLDEDECSQLLRKQDPHMTPAQMSRLIAVVGRSPLGLVEACRLYRERATSWEDLADRLANPANQILTGPGRLSRQAIARVRSILHDRLTAEPDLLPLLVLLLGFGPSPVWLWMLQAGAAGDVSAAVRRILGDPAALRRALQVLVGIGLARRPANGEWIEVPAIVRLMLRELVPTSWKDTNRRDVMEILVQADPAHPEDRRTSARHHAITPHLRPAALVDWFRPSAYRAVHHQIRFLFRAGDLKAAQQLGRDAEAALARQSVLAPTDELVLQIRRDLANALRADGRYVEADRLTDEAMALIAADPAYQPDHAIALDLARSRGHDLRIAGRYQEAYESDAATVLRHAAVFGDNDLRHLASRYNLSVSRRFLGRYAEALQADRADLDQLRGDDRRQSRLTNALAEDLHGLGRYEDLVDLLAPVVESESGRELHRARRMSGVAFRRLGHLVPAVEQLSVCYQACLNELGEHRELTLAVCMSFGNALRELGQFDTALHYCRRAVEGYTTALGEDNPLVRVAQVNLAAVHLARGDVDRAEPILDGAHAALTEQVGDRHPFTVLAAVNRASAAAMSDPVSAWSWSSRAHTLALEVFGADHLDTLVAAAGLAADRAARNDDDALAPSLDQVLSTLRRRFGAGHPLVTRVAHGSRVLVDIELPSA